jgi:molybdenum cofactor cytidylyltransferase
LPVKNRQLQIICNWRMSDMQIALIILAAGQSRRFGPANKLTALVGGEPMAAGLARRLGGVDVPGCTVSLMAVVDPNATDVTAILAPMVGRFGLTLIENPRAEEGIGSSIACAIQSLPAAVDAAIITPGDLPLLGRALIERLIQAFRDAGGQRPAHVTLADGTPVSPMIWPRHTFDALSRLTGDVGAKSLLPRYEPLGVDLRDTADLLDVDTPADLERVAGVVGNMEKP